MSGPAPAPADWEHHLAEEMGSLVIGSSMTVPETPELPVDQPQDGVNGDSSAPGSSTVEAAAHELPGANAEQHVDVPVDHALKDALAHPKNRAAVLKLEEEVEMFVMSAQATQHVFARDMTSYERLLAHRTAQHWGLETTTISQGPDQGKIVAYRAPHTRVPKVKLSEVHVTMSELPSTSSSSGAAAGANSPAQAPRVLVRKRPDRLGLRSGGGGQGDMMHGGGAGMPFSDGGLAAANFRTVEERQQEYHRARARIFGGEGGSGSGGYVGQPQMPGHMRGPPPPGAAVMYPGGGMMPTSPPSPFPMSPSRAAAGAGSFGQPMRGGWAGGMAPGGGGNGNGNGNSGRKAVLRNKHEDLADPDFRRHRNTGPRFDPGFGEDEVSQQSLYIRPTYSSEFPELGLGGVASPSSRGGSRPSGAGGMPPTRQSPRRGNGGGSGGMMSPVGGPMGAGAGQMGGAPGSGMYPMSPYGSQMPPGMMAASPMGPFMMPPGMMVAGPMPGGMGGGMAMAYSPGGTAMPFHPGTAGFYPMPAPYGYYPMQPAGSGELQASMQYAAVPYGYPGMAPGAAAAMGGFPGGPAAAAAMAAMTAPMPVPQSPHSSSGQSPYHGGMGRQRSNGTRSRNSSGGSAHNGHTTSNPASAPNVQQPQSQQQPQQQQQQQQQEVGAGTPRDAGQQAAGEEAAQQ